MDIDPAILALEERSPEALTLAKHLSLAVRIEPDLVRQMRLSLSGLSVSAEADLWFSDLVEAQNTRGISFVPELANTLRQLLATEDPKHYEHAWRVVETFHQSASWSIRLEEKINYLSQFQDVDSQQEIENILLVAGQQMVDHVNSADISRWLLRALMRLPESLQDNEASQMLRIGAEARLDKRVELQMDNMPSDAVENWLPWFLSRQTTRVTIRVRLLNGIVEIEPGADEYAKELDIPDTKPLLLGLRWHENKQAYSEIIQFSKGENRRIPVPSAVVELFSASGERYQLSFSAKLLSGSRELDFQSIRAASRPFLARKREMKILEEWVSARDSIVISGEKGAGKTAILSRCLDIYEYGATHVVYYFFGQPELNDPSLDTFFNSLIEQLEFYYPGSMKKIESLLRHEENTLIRMRELVRHLRRLKTPVIIGIDNLSEWLAKDTYRYRFFSILGGDLSGSKNICLILTIDRQLTQELELAKDSNFKVLDLDKTPESGQELCEAYLSRYAPNWFVRLLDRSQGDISKQLLTIAILSENPLTLEQEQVLDNLSSENLRYVAINALQEAKGRIGILKFLESNVNAALFLTDSLDKSLLTIRRYIRDLSANLIPLFIATNNTNIKLPSDLDHIEVIVFGYLRDEAFVRNFHEKLYALTEEQYRLPYVLTDLARFNIARLKRMLDWLIEQGMTPERINKIPPTLYDQGQKAWQELQAKYGGQGFIYIVGLICLAKEPLPIYALNQLQEMTTFLKLSFSIEAVLNDLEQKNFINIVTQVLTEKELSDEQLSESQANIEQTVRLVAPSHPSIAQLVRASIDESVVSDCIAMLAGNKYSREKDSFWNNHHLKYEVYYYLDQYPNVIEWVLDLNRLQMLAMKFSVDDIEDELRFVMSHDLDADTSSLVSHLYHAVQRERTAIIEAPNQLAMLLCNRLLQQGVEKYTIKSRFNFQTRDVPLLFKQQFSAQNLAVAAFKVADYKELRCLTSIGGGSFAVAGTDTGKVLVLNLDKYEVVKTIEAHSQAINSIVYDRDMRSIWVCSEDATISCLTLKQCGITSSVSRSSTRREKIAVETRQSDSAPKLKKAAAKKKASLKAKKASTPKKKATKTKTKAKTKKSAKKKTQMKNAVKKAAVKKKPVKKKVVKKDAVKKSVAKKKAVKKKAVTKKARPSKTLSSKAAFKTAKKKGAVKKRTVKKKASKKAGVKKKIMRKK